ncbi:MAG: IS701 family transposase [Acetobacteraceae bacterium]|nr:IS701 family transposase [Acetobacteraceae bacterium]
MALGHADRVAPLRRYCTGLLLPGERKSIEPMAARVEPGRVGAAHQSLHHLIAKADWSDAAVLAVVRAQVLPAIQERGPIQAWIVDDTGFPKKGTHSVGVARQYCGQLGKQENCQVAVSLSVANQHASLPVAWRLYLPKAWAEDAARRAKAGVPDELHFATKPQIALEQMRRAQADGIPPGTVLADAGYGVDTDFRDGITGLGLRYVVGIQSSASLWPPGQAPLPVKPHGGRGRPTTRVRRSAEHKPISAGELAASLPKGAWRRVTWRQGTHAPLASRFAAIRVRPAHRDYQAATPRAEEWCLTEWPVGEAEPTKSWLSTLPASTSRASLVRHAMLRWRIERDCQEMKQEIGLGHYEGRGWRGFHHHATLCIAAYGFLIAERAAIPPSAERRTPFIQAPDLPRTCRPRGAADPA